MAGTPRPGERFANRARSAACGGFALIVLQAIHHGTAVPDVRLIVRARVPFREPPVEFDSEVAWVPEARPAPPDRQAPAARST